MAAKKGHRKSGGRSKGTPNKVTQTTREWVQMLIDNNRERLENDFEALEPKERWQLIEKLMQYVIPKKREEEQPDTDKTRSEIIKRMFGFDNDF